MVDQKIAKNPVSLYVVVYIKDSSIQYVASHLPRRGDAETYKLNQKLNLHKNLKPSYVSMNINLRVGILRVEKATRGPLRWKGTKDLKDQ